MGVICNDYYDLAIHWLIASTFVSFDTKDDLPFIFFLFYVFFAQSGQLLISFNNLPAYASIFLLFFDIVNV